MKRREEKKKISKAPPAPADLLVCFPARSHLTLLPKPINSPARTSSDSKQRHHFLKKSVTKKSQLSSPLIGGEISSEPTSPKVTCAGQIKIRPKTSRSGKTWQSVLEEIERIHNQKKQKKKPNWGGESLSFKKEIFHFLSCLRGIRFDFRCFRGFPPDDVTTEDESDDEEEEEESNKDSKNMFSKWLMVLEEGEEEIRNSSDVSLNNVPPSNALLLMRCKSAPEKNWLKEKTEREQEEEERKRMISLKLLMEEEKMKKKKEKLMVMNYYDDDFYKLSLDIAKETWVVSGSSSKDDNDDLLLRSRSWKR